MVSNYRKDPGRLRLLNLRKLPRMCQALGIGAARPFFDELVGHSWWSSVCVCACVCLCVAYECILYSVFVRILRICVCEYCIVYFVHYSVYFVQCTVFCRVFCTDTKYCVLCVASGLRPFPGQECAVTRKRRQVGQRGGAGEPQRWERRREEMEWVGVRRRIWTAWWWMRGVFLKCCRTRARSSRQKLPKVTTTKKSQKNSAD